MCNKNTFDLADCLIQAQKSITEHPTIIRKIRNHYKNINASFNEIESLLTKLLHISIEKEKYLQNILKLIAGIVTYPTSNKEEIKWNNNFGDSMFRLCSKMSSSANYIVRQRSSQLVGKILNLLPQNYSISESTFENLLHHFSFLLNDKVASIRAITVMSISRLQSSENDKDTLIDILKELLIKDSNKKVRIACLNSITINRDTLNNIITRVRDISKDVRAETFIVLKEKVDIKCLSIFHRNTILKSGLKDREKFVRKECNDLLINKWYPSCSNIFEFLKLLYPEMNEEDSKIILEHLIAKKVDFKVDHPPYMEDVTNEKAFFWRIYWANINKQDINNYSEFQSNLPEIGKLFPLMENYRKKSFIFKSFLFICKHYEYNDYIDKNIAIKYTRKWLRDIPNTENEYITLIIYIIRKVIKNEVDFIGHLIVIINDIYDQMVKSSDNIIKVDTIDNKKEIEILKRLLYIIIDLLTYIQRDIDLSIISKLKNKYILNFMRNEDHDIRLLSVKALGLYCTLDVEEAKKFLIIFYHCLKNDHEAIQIQSMKIIFDLMIFHNCLVRIDIKSLIKRESEIDDVGSNPILIDSLYQYLSSEYDDKMYTAIEGLSKLLYLGIIEDIKPITLMTLLLFFPVKNEYPVNQLLSLFFSSFLDIKKSTFKYNAILYSNCFGPMIKILRNEPNSSKISELSVTKVLQWLFSLFPCTDLLINQKEKTYYSENASTIRKIREKLISVILNEINDGTQVKFRRELSKIISRVKLDKEIKDKSILTNTKKIIENLNDHISIKFLNKFYERIKECD